MLQGDTAVCVPWNALGDRLHAGNHLPRQTDREKCATKCFSCQGIPAPILLGDRKCVQIVASYARVLVMPPFWRIRACSLRVNRLQANNRARDLIQNGYFTPSASDLAARRGFCLLRLGKLETTNEILPMFAKVFIVRVAPKCLDDGAERLLTMTKQAELYTQMMPERGHRWLDGDRLARQFDRPFRLTGCGQHPA